MVFCLMLGRAQWIDREDIGDAVFRDGSQARHT